MSGRAIHRPLMMRHFRRCRSSRIGRPVAISYTAHLMRTAPRQVIAVACHKYRRSAPTLLSCRHADTAEEALAIDKSIGEGRWKVMRLRREDAYYYDRSTRCALIPARTQDYEASACHQNRSFLIKSRCS